MTAARTESLVAVLAVGWVMTVTMAICQATLARLWFRHRIEVIRDEAVTAVLDGIIPHTGQLARWLAELETITHVSRRGDVELAAAVLIGLEDGDGPAASWPGLDPVGRGLLVDLANRARVAARTCLIWSRPAAVVWPVQSSRPGTSPAKTTASDPCKYR